MHNTTTNHAITPVERVKPPVFTWYNTGQIKHVPLTWHAKGWTFCWETISLHLLCF